MAKKVTFDILGGNKKIIFTHDGLKVAMSQKYCCWCKYCDDKITPMKYSVAISGLVVCGCIVEGNILPPEQKPGDPGGAEGTCTIDATFDVDYVSGQDPCMWQNLDVGTITVKTWTESDCSGTSDVDSGTAKAYLFLAANGFTFEIYAEGVHTPGNYAYAFRSADPGHDAGDCYSDYTIEDDGICLWNPLAAAEFKLCKDATVMITPGW